MDRFSGRDDGDRAPPRGGMGQASRGGLGAFIKSSTSMGSSGDDQKPIAATSVTLSRAEQARAQQARDTAKRVTAAVAAAVAADPARTGASAAEGRPASGFQPPDWAEPPPAGLVLQGLKNGEVVQRQPLTQRAILFGRLATADLQLEHASISRQHAALCFRPDGTAVLMDLDSAHGTFLDGKRLSKHEPVELKEGVEVRFGASTRAFFLRREGATGSARKRGVQWPDEDAGSAKKRDKVELETVMGFSDGGSFAAGIGPAPAGSQQQGRFAGAVSAIVKPAARSTSSAGGVPSPTAATSAPAGTTATSGATKEQAETEEDRAAARKRLAAERFREYMKSHAQKQSSFYDELPPPAAEGAAAEPGAAAKSGAAAPAP